ncbi:MAG: zinc-ribbon domain-containing protein [Candidatus Binatia bacterium]
MFCTHCGTQIDEGKKFCKNCGASVAKVDESASTMVLPKLEPTSSTGEPTRRAVPTQDVVSDTQPIRMFPNQRSGISASIVIAAVVLLLVVGGGAGVYFGTDLFRDFARTDNASAPGAEPLASNPKPPPITPIEGDKIPEGPNVHDLNRALRSSPAEPLPPAETPRSNEPASKPSRQSSNQQGGSKVPAQDRVARTPTSPPAPRRPAFNPGTYETVRATNVFDGPTPSARIVAGIEHGVRINVVASNGDWLEVHSRHGKPPGFIRKDDARLVERTDQ